MEKLRGLLVNMPDLIKGLTRIHYGKVSHCPTSVAPVAKEGRPLPPKSRTSSSAWKRVGARFPQDTSDVFPLGLAEHDLEDAAVNIPAAKSFLDAINIKAAKDEDLANLWNDVDKFPEVQDAKM